MYIDRMGIEHADGETAPDYGTLYLISRDLRNVCDFRGSDTGDIDKLSLLTNCSAGSTCLMNNGDIYIKNLDGTWAKFGEEETTSSSASNTASLNLSPMDIDKAALTSDVSFDEGEGSALEAQKSAVTSSTADEVRV